MRKGRRNKALSYNDIASHSHRARLLIMTMTPSPELKDRIGFYELERNQDSFARLERLLERSVDAGLEQFYEKLTGTPELQRFFASRDRITHARSAQRDHWIQLFRKGLDQSYVDRTRIIGNTHARIGLEPKWYIGGYALIMEHLINGMMLRGFARFMPGRRRMAKDLVALVKVAMIDMDMALSVYFAKAEETTREIVLGQMGTALKSLAEGDLTTRMTGLPESYRQAEDDFNAATARLAETIGLVSQGTENLATSSSEIRAASDNLAERTERQASNVQDCARAMNELSDGLGRTAQSMTHLRKSANEAENEANQGREAVREAVDAMADAQQSAQEIVQITEIIDGLAFQTNLLALNAGVEAARVGEMGRGFAVVANEVRALAQRSSEAADNIKRLLSSSREQVDRGAELVKGAGTVLHSIIGKVTDISGGVSDAAQLTQEQAERANDVNRAIAEMDVMTQQNAAMVEQSAAATRSMSDTTGKLGDAVARFRITFGGSGRGQVNHLRAA